MIATFTINSVEYSISSEFITYAREGEAGSTILAFDRTQTNQIRALEAMPNDAEVLVDDTTYADFKTAMSDGGFYEFGHASYTDIFVNCHHVKRVEESGSGAVLTMYRSDVIAVSDSYEDTLSAIRTATTISPSGLAVTTIEVDLGRTPLSRGTFTVTDAGVTSTTKIMIWQAMSSLTGKGSLADENEMDTLLLKATAGTGNFKVNWEANEGFVLAPVITGGFVKGGILTSRPNTGAYPTADINRLFRTVKLGKVVGKFKFNYIKI
jgi:hypothetical protein